MTILTKAICRFNAILIKDPMDFFFFFTEIEKASKIHVEPQMILERQSNLEHRKQRFHQHGGIWGSQLSVHPLMRWLNIYTRISPLWEKVRNELRDSYEWGNWENLHMEGVGKAEAHSGTHPILSTVTDNWGEISNTQFDPEERSAWATLLVP